MQQDNRVLGRDVRGPIGAEQLDAVPWSHGNTDATVEFTTNELTATCPITGQPDFYELKLVYRPKEALIESKSLKLYLWGFRHRGIFAEDLAATLLKDLVAACDPVEMRVDLTQQVRGGLQIRTVVRHPSSQPVS
jgi:7-cyano-7-deazaguanine reductase